MDNGTSNSSTQSAVNNSAPTVQRQNSKGDHLTSILSPSGISSWAKSFRNPQPPEAAEDDSKAGNAGMSAIARFSSGFGLRIPSMSPVRNDGVADTTSATQSGVFESFTKGLVDTSQNAVKAMQVKARHIVSQNKRRYQVVHVFYIFFHFIVLVVFVLCSVHISFFYSSYKLQYYITFKPVLMHLGYGK